VVRKFAIEVFSTSSQCRGSSQVDRLSFWWVAEGVRPCKGTVEWRLLWWFARRFGLAKELS